MRLPARIAVATLLLLGAAQLVPVGRTDPPIESDVPAPPEVKAVLRRACYDCHSNETAWPLQAYVAPASWLVAHDVKEGREKLNFSRWARIEERLPGKTASEIRKAISEGEMPPWVYVLAHPSARLSGADRALLSAWAAGLGGTGGR